jgi:hypothetical protein
MTHDTPRPGDEPGLHHQALEEATTHLLGDARLVLPAALARDRGAR